MSQQQRGPGQGLKGCGHLGKGEAAAIWEAQEGQGIGKVGRIQTRRSRQGDAGRRSNCVLTCRAQKAQGVNGEQSHSATGPSEGL